MCFLIDYPLLKYLPRYVWDRTDGKLAKGQASGGWDTRAMGPSDKQINGPSSTTQNDDKKRSCKSPKSYQEYSNLVHSSCFTGILSIPREASTTAREIVLQSSFFLFHGGYLV